ncbi:nucleotidyltransferase family protein [Sphingobacterium corticis]|uniref:Nucleotidyltransferase family protein n=1 Tax=Sphingobacterium corticis TaxID=1812823 RepID=A0ABW5NGN4_9SPHI
MKSRQVFLSLLKSGLWNSAVSDLHNFPLTDVQWQDIYIKSLNHTVEGLIYLGVTNLPSEFMPPRAILLPWIARVSKIEQRHAWMNDRVSEQLSFFRSHGLDPFLLKGQGVGRCYENPELRLAGDIDWCFPNKNDYDKAKKVLTESGLDVEATAGYSSQTIWSGAEVELHQRMIDIHNPFKDRFVKNLINAQEPIKFTADNQQIDWKLPSPLLTHVSVSIHILKHLLSYGIGLRQWCDAVRICYTFSAEINGSKLREVYRKLGVLKFINVYHGVLVNYLGLPAEYLPFPYDRHAFTDTLIHDVWEAGNFGFSLEKHVGAEAKNSGKRKEAKQRIWNSFVKYLPFAPAEALSFPLVQFYSRFNQ